MKCCRGFVETCILCRAACSSRLCSGRLCALEGCVVESYVF